MKSRQPLFSQAELARLRRMWRLMRELGMNLAAVEIILRLTDELATLRTGR
jgi:DNA-binding transcriptional MerR regulator